MDVNEILFRCSSLGYLMVEPKSKTEEISETTKTHLVDVFVSNRYNRFEEVNGKALDKGNETEEDSITTVCRIIGKYLEKNEEHLSNEYIKGTPDLFIGKSIREATEVRDTKSSWSAFTFFRAMNKKLDPKYYWQVMGYMDLTGAKIAYIDYCLNNTPYHLIESELRKESYSHPELNTPEWIELQIIANHVYDKKTFDQYIQMRGIVPSDTNSMAIIKGFVEIPLKERHFCFEVERKGDQIANIRHKVKLCREYIKENFLDKEVAVS